MAVYLEIDYHNFLVSLGTLRASFSNSTIPVKKTSEQCGASIGD